MVKTIYLDSHFKSKQKAPLPDLGEGAFFIYKNETNKRWWHFW